MSYRKWAWGLVPLAALAIAAIATGTPNVERDLEARIAPVLSGRGVHAEVRGRDVYLSPAASGGAAALDVRDAVANVSGVRRVAIAESARAQTAPDFPFRFEIERTDEGMFVSGFAPGASERAAILAAMRTAAAPGVVSGDLALAPGLPSTVDFEIAARFAAVQAARLANGRVLIDGDQLTVSGKTPDGGALNALLDAVRPPLPGGLRLGAVSVQALPPLMRPFLFVAERTAKGIVLSGGVPSPEARALLFDMAREIVGAAVVDRLTTASGAHDDFPSFATFGLMKLSHLTEGRFTLTDASFVLEGEAADADAAEAVTRGLPSAPMGLATQRIDVRLAPAHASPFVWGAVVEGERLALRGVVPDEGVAAMLLETARGFFPGRPVTNDMRIARGGPEGFAAAAGAALEALSRLVAGRVELRDSKLTIAGSLPAGRASEDLLSTVRREAPKFILDASGLAAALTRQAPVDQPAPAQEHVLPDQCANAAGQVPVIIHFALGSARPDKVPAELLRDVARIARACSGLIVEVSGHTDVFGARRANLRMSQARARAVERLLRAEGAPRDRIDVRSYAYDRPIARPPSALEARAQNRRVEVVLRPGAQR